MSLLNAPLLLPGNGVWVATDLIQWPGTWSDSLLCRQRIKLYYNSTLHKNVTEDGNGVKVAEN